MSDQFPHYRARLRAGITLPQLIVAGTRIKVLGERPGCVEDPLSFWAVAYSWKYNN